MDHLRRLRPASLTFEQVIFIGAIVRLGLFSVPSLSEALQRRPEASTPLTSFRNLKEGVFIHEHGSNPYIGGVFHHSPLLLYWFTTIMSVESERSTGIAWTIMDVLSAVSLVDIWKARNPKAGQKRDALVAALFLFNPYALLSCIAKSTTSIDNAALLLAISTAAKGQAWQSLVLLALATHLSLYPVLILVPLIMVILRAPAYEGNRQLNDGLRYALSFFVFMLAFSKKNHSLGGFSWIEATWGAIIKPADLTPNVGMWWYFFTEMFDHFRSFFLGVFQLHTLIYVVPVCLRLSDDPLSAVLVLVGIFSTWKSYPTLGDMAAWAGLLGCFPEIVSNLRHPLFSLTVHLYTSILLPLLHSLWLLTGTGNANFFYAATMVYGLNASLAIVDVMGAAMRLKVKRGIAAWLKEDERERVEDISVGELDKLLDAKGWATVQFTSSEA
ncbi:hypothetical protein IAT38_002943 [Cryptococcus sp. DSM 104549]